MVVTVIYSIFTYSRSVFATQCPCNNSLLGALLTIPFLSATLTNQSSVLLGAPPTSPQSSTVPLYLSHCKCPSHYPHAPGSILTISTSVPYNKPFLSALLGTLSSVHL
jgi:hypothetical protein